MKDDFFIPENAQVERRSKHLSPSGKYKLIVTPYSTQSGAFSYSQGLVYVSWEEKPIAEIRRNPRC